MAKGKVVGWPVVAEEEAVVHEGDVAVVAGGEGGVVAENVLV